LPIISAGRARFCSQRHTRFFTFKKIFGDSVVFQAMNVLAGIGLAISLFLHGACPLTFVNLVWSVIKVIAIFVAIKNGKNID
jgi:hypothetical protein